MEKKLPKINIATGDKNADWIKLVDPKATAEDRAIHEELGKKNKKKTNGSKTA